ncbi:MULTISPECIES: YcnI family protein [unclassified Listeria]|uniref:YcnI family copper-binding membrane protein n=1 Tax=unclassified Listeria TaxID=2642072 RepID=UPI000B58836C|nr:MULTISPECIES: DUF1775 domain-containing protein [unclassified Listeria]
MKKWIVMCSVAMLVWGFPALVSAHVSVSPSESQTGAYETYTMKVPVEKESNTTKIVLKMPAGATYVSYEPVAGFKTTFDKSKNVITWEATGAGILPGQFMRFSFIASNPEKAAQLNWDAFQYYADGSIVEWTGDANSDTPHAVTTVNRSSVPQTDAHGNTTSKEQDEKNEFSAWLIYTTLGISLLAIIVSLFALLRKKK